MRRFKMLVFSEPFEGQDDEFNAWYTNQHLNDLVALPGFTSAQRFTLHSASMGTTLNKYLAIYDVETDDPEGVIEHMFAVRDTEAALFLKPVGRLAQCGRTFMHRYSLPFLIPRPCRTHGNIGKRDVCFQDGANDMPTLLR